MRNILAILLIIVIVFSFSGCLKDDYEALLLEIDDAEEEVDDIKDEIDDIEEEISSVNEQIALASQENEELLNESEDLLYEKENIEEEIEFYSYTGLGFTKFQYEQAIDELIYLDDYFYDITTTYIPYNYVEDYGRCLTYYLEYEGNYSSGLYWDLVLCEDNIHISEILIVCDLDIASSYSDAVNMYVYGMIFAVIMIIEDEYEDFDYLYDIFYEVDSGETFLDDTVAYYQYSDNGYYMFSVYDANE